MTESESIQELLVDQLKDILHAEKQLLKALPKMAKAARFTQLQRLLEQHLEETEAQVERLNDCFGLLGENARANMQGHDGSGGGRRRGDARDGKKKDDAAADLALDQRGATGRALRDFRLHHRTQSGAAAPSQRIVQYLNMSLAEEENADQLLNQVARTLMSAAKMPAPVE